MGEFQSPPKLLFSINQLELVVCNQGCFISTTRLYFSRVYECLQYCRSGQSWQLKDWGNDCSLSWSARFSENHSIIRAKLFSRKLIRAWKSSRTKQHCHLFGYQLLYRYMYIRPSIPDYRYELPSNTIWKFSRKWRPENEQAFDAHIREFAAKLSGATTIIFLTVVYTRAFLRELEREKSELSYCH